MRWAGAEIVESVPLLTPARDVVGGHHERYDGAGYPGGLTAERPYRRVRPLGGALEMLRAEAGKRFGPRIVEAALEIPPTRWAEILGKE